MASIDNRVVSITFDNSAFERNVQQTLRTLAMLKSSLDFQGAGDSLADVSAAASKFSLAGIGDAVENISSKFSAMGAIAFSVINNITSRATDMAVNLAKQFTIAPVTDGFAEYELKMGSIQTIMSGSGESLETVNRKLEELNRYSDETIYSFADMTQNIGKFTNAGLSLDQSVSSIQGVANVAAISGANAEEASRAMYNFAQSLSAGSVKLIDWKSIENANMATAGFKTELLESAVAAGTLAKDADGLYTTLKGTPVSATKGFNESLQEQWMTTEVLNETLGRYSDTSTEIGKKATAAATDIKTFSQMMDTLKESAGSGWAVTFETIFGNFEQGKKLWTGIGEAAGDLISQNAEARNAVLKIWSEGGGRSLLIESLGDAMKALGSILSTVRDAFREVFPAKTGRDLLKMTVSFSKLVEALTPSEKTLKNLKSVFLGLFSAVKIVIEVIKGVASVFTGLFKLLAGGSSGTILSFFAKIGDAVNALRLALVDGGGIASYFEKINAAIAKFVGNINLEPVINAFEKFGTLVRRAWAFFAAGFGDDGLMGTQAARLGGIADVFYKIGDGLSNLVGKVKNFFNALDFGALETAVDSVKSAFQSLFTGKDGEEGIVPAAAGESVSKFATVLSYLGDALKAVGSFIGSVFSGLGKVGSVAKNAAKALGSGLKTVWESIAEVFGGGGPPSIDTILKVLAGGAFAAIGAAFVKFAKDGFKIDFGQLDFLDELSESLSAVTGVMKSMQKDILAGALLKIAVAIGVLTLSLIALSFVDGVKLAASMTAVAAGLGLLVGALAGLDKIASGDASAVKIAALAAALLLVGGAMFLLAMAATLMATSDPDALAVGMLGLLGALEMIGRVMERLTKNTDGLVKAAFSVGVLGASLILLSLGLKAMSTLDLEDLAVGLGGTAGALILISRTVGKMPSDGMVKAALSIGVLSLSMMILARAIKDMSDIGIVDTVVGLTTMAVALKLITDALKKMAGPDVLKAGGALLLVSFSIGKMADGVERLGGIDIWTLVKGMTALAVMFRVIGASMNAAKQSLGGGAALLLTSVAIMGFAMAVERMAAIPFWDLIKGLGAVMLSMAALAGLSYVLAAAVPILAALGAGLALIGLGAAGFGAGVYLVAAGIGILARVGPKGVEVFLESLDDLLAALPKVALALGKAAATFVGGFISGLDELIPLVVKIIGQLLVAIREIIPEFLETAGAVIVAFLDYITTLYPAIVQAGWDLLLAFLRGIEENIGELASTAIGILTNFINAMAEGIPDYVRAMVNLWTTVLTTMAYELGILITTLAPQMGMALMDGILTGLRDTGGKIIDFFTEWIGQVIDWVKSLFGINSPSTVFSEIGTFLIDGLLGGITDTIGAVMDFFTNLLGDILGWIGDAAGALFSTGGDVITGLWEGHWAMIWKISDFFNGLIDDIKGWIGDAAGALLSTGKSFLTGMLSGLREKIIDVMNWFKDLPGRIIGWIGDSGRMLWNVGTNIVIGLWNGIKEKFLGWMQSKLGWMWGLIPGWVKSALGIKSPSRVMMKIGGQIGEGLGLGIFNQRQYLEKASNSMSNAVTNGFSVDEKELTSPIRSAVAKAANAMQDLDGFDGQPVIRPVVDLTDVKRGSVEMNRLLNMQQTLSNAQSLSSAFNANRPVDQEGSGATEIRYEQTINAPTELSTADIYRQTKSLIALTKAEANIA